METLQAVRSTRTKCTSSFIVSLNHTLTKCLIHSANGPTSSPPSSTPNATATNVISGSENAAQPEGKVAAMPSATVSLYLRIRSTVSFVSDVYLCMYSGRSRNIYLTLTPLGQYRVRILVGVHRTHTVVLLFLRLGARSLWAGARPPLIALSNPSRHSAIQGMGVCQRGTYGLARPDAGRPGGVLVLKSYGSAAPSVFCQLCGFVKRGCRLVWWGR